MERAVCLCPSLWRRNTKSFLSVSSLASSACALSPLFPTVKCWFTAVSLCLDTAQWDIVAHRVKGTLFHLVPRSWDWAGRCVHKVAWCGLAGYGKQVIFTKQAMTLGALLSHISSCCIDTLIPVCLILVSIESRRCWWKKHKDHSAYVLFKNLGGRQCEKIWLTLPIKQWRDCRLLVPWQSWLDWQDFETGSKLGVVLRNHIKDNKSMPNF